jgi:dipeptidyl aminopeptidase/acylaminoacyl peptidase
MNINCFMRRSALLLVATLVLLTSAVAQTSPQISTETFFKKPAVRAPALSPSGKQIAMLVPNQSGRVGLAVANIETPDKFVGIAQFEDADVRSFSWVNDQRLVFDAFDQLAALGDQLGNGLYAVNADGSDFIWLIERTGNYRVTGNPVKRPLPARYRYLEPVHDGSDDVLIQRWIPTGQGYPATSMMMRLNTRTMGTRNLYNDPLPDGVQAWALDQKLQARALLTFDGKQTLAVYWREEGSSAWVQLTSYSIYDTDQTAFAPVGIDRDGQLYVSAINKDSADLTKALYRYDIKQRQLDSKPLLSLPGFDFEGSMHFDAVSKKLLAVNYVQDAQGVAWFDSNLSQVQQLVDKLLPNTINSITCERCNEVRHLVVTASSDIQSPIYFLFDRETQKLKLIGATRPWLDSRNMAGTQEFFRVKARDGLEIPVYVTKPKSKGPWPTVIMVHGGPNVRGLSWGFNPANQFLASRGYMVVEPEFRGSMGYGDKLFKAGWKQWGLTMQDDVTDVTRWAIANDWADAKRIAIAGGSYGGYATMMGLLKEPALYKAGINIVGVTDIALMYEIGWSDFMDADNPWVRFGMPLMVGDRDKDAAQFTATSPLKQAAQIKQPVLMAYGEDDLRVPLPHGTKMRDALIASGNKNVEWVQYEGEGHGFMLTKNNVDLWGRVERFLAKHLN